VEKFWIFPNRVDVRVIAIDYNGISIYQFQKNLNQLFEPVTAA